MSNTVECPYCEHENDVTDALQDLNSDNLTDWECCNCEVEFELQAEFEPSWGASKIDYVECERCGDVTRDIKRKGSIFSYPKTYNEKALCEPCWRAGVLKDMERGDFNG